jgi:hypothetical protein
MPRLLGSLLDQTAHSPPSAPDRPADGPPSPADPTARARSVLTTFFRRRLRDDPTRRARPEQVQRLVRRTLARLARHHSGRRAPQGSAPRTPPARKADLLRAALMECRRLEDAPDRGGEPPLRSRP